METYLHKYNAEEMKDVQLKGSENIKSMINKRTNQPICSVHSSYQKQFLQKLFISGKISC